MIELTRYQCEHCGSYYETQAECQACENAHVAIDAIASAKYNQGQRYPYYITLTMHDGKTKSFKLV